MTKPENNAFQIGGLHYDESSRARIMVRGTRVIMRRRRFEYVINAFGAIGFALLLSSLIYWAARAAGMGV